MMPKVQLLFGDTAGVGPELAVKLPPIFRRRPKACR